MSNETPPCWLHPDAPVPGCNGCPPANHCVSHGPYYGDLYDCPGCLKEMERHASRARNALVAALRQCKKDKKPPPNIVRCARARADQMEKVIKSLGVDIIVEPQDGFEWHKFQLLRNGG